MPIQCTNPLAPDHIQMCACVISVSLAYCIVYLMYCIVSLAYCVVKAVSTFLHAWVGNQLLDEAARTLKKRVSVLWFCKQLQTTERNSVKEITDLHQRFCVLWDMHQGLVSYKTCTQVWCPIRLVPRFGVL